MPTEYDKPPGKGSSRSFDEPERLRKDDLEDETYFTSNQEKTQSFPMREVSIPFVKGNITFNPVTSLIGVVFLWGLSIWCLVEPEQSKKTLGEWKTWTSDYFTWFYIGTQGAWFFLAVIIAIVFGDLKLGKKDDKPEFSDGTFFSMIFSCGVAVGLFFYGVSEPLYHLSDNRFAAAGYHNQDELDEYAINMTLTHWGFAAWGCYVIVALAVGMATYRFGLPLTLRSTIYPLVGDLTWGWLGDVVDGTTIVVIVSGVCTSLGLGALQITAGLKTIGVVSTDSDSDDVVVAIIIWAITGAATLSVVSGLNYGIKTLSQVAFLGGCALWFLVLAFDKTEYMLNLVVQATGYYLQNSIFYLNFVTDAFSQLKEGEGRAIDGKSAAIWFMDGWTVFYYAWWTAWSSFVGLFIARISKGRTLREVVGYSLFAPTLYAILWFCVFGGAGLRSNRVAMEIQKASLLAYNDSDRFLVPGSPVCYNVPPADIVDSSTNKILFTPVHTDIGPVCRFNGDDPDSAWFNVLEQYKAGRLMSILSMFCIAIYFVTSSDSGSLIVDHLASNGSENHHVAQRVFWAVTEGAVASALLYGGGSDALKALQAASIVAGLPFTLLLCFVSYSLWLFCQKARDIDNGVEKEEFVFKSPLFGGVFNIIEVVFSAGRISEASETAGLGAPTSSQVREFFIGLGLPFLSYLRVRRKLFPKTKDALSNLLSSIFYAGFFYGAFILFFVSSAIDGVVPFAWLCLLSAAAMLASLRSTVRGRFNIGGGAVMDFLASFVLWAQVSSQLVLQFDEEETTAAVSAHDV